jgi:hypothetical protein
MLATLGREFRDLHRLLLLSAQGELLRGEQLPDSDAAELALSGARLDRTLSAILAEVQASPASEIPSWAQGLHIAGKPVGSVSYTPVATEIAYSTEATSVPSDTHLSAGSHLDKP